MPRTRTDELLLGEWACLGILTQGPSHGFAIAARLAPTGDVGRVWSLARPLTYRALDQLAHRGYVEAVGEERGRAGGNRTILAITPAGRSSLRGWLAAPVLHLRDVRADLLLKLVICDLVAVDPLPLLVAQREAFAPMVRTLDSASGRRGSGGDPVALWRYEFSRAVLRFLDRLITRRSKEEVPDRPPPPVSRRRSR